MEKPIRKLITGIDPITRESIIIDDELISSFIPYPKYPSFQIQELFYCEDSPLSLATRHTSKEYDINLPEKAVRFMKIRMPTKAEIMADLRQAGENIPQDWHKFNLHRTDSIDYIYILSGHITCIIGNKTIELSQGDFLTQIGPEHTWINDNDQPCYIFCVMMGIQPEGIPANACF